MFPLEGWVFQRVMPTTSSETKLFPGPEAIIQVHIKKIKPNYRYYFDRLLGSVTLRYSLDPTYN
jgi:hypothetical protein